MKVIVLTRGGLTDAWEKTRSKTCRKKSAEAIVPGVFSGSEEQAQVLSKRKKEVGAMRAEYPGNEGFLQRESVEHEEYAEARSADKPEIGEKDVYKRAAESREDLLELILNRGNLNRAYRQVKYNKGAPGIDGMSVEGLLPWPKECTIHLPDR